MDRRNEDDYSKAHRVVTKQPDSVLGTVGSYQVTAKRRFQDLLRRIGRSDSAVKFRGVT
jgi:hypothetical protein